MIVLRCILACCFSLGITREIVYSQPPETRESWVAILREDPRLKDPVKLQFTTVPAAAEVLDIVQKATGVPLTWAGESEKGKANFGILNAHMPAWQTLEIIALHQVADGRWEKSGDGYVLHGTPKDFGPRGDPEKNKALRKALEDGLAAKSAKLYGDFTKAHPLYIDAKLHAILDLEKGVKLPDLLERLASATGLKYTLADNLTHHDPALGFVEQKKAPVYWVMEGILRYDLDDGRWEKIEGGYRLEGVSRALNLPPKTYGWIWITGGSLAALTVLGGAVLIYRRRRC